MTTVEQVKYEVMQNGNVASTHRIEDRAIKAARKIAAEMVIMQVKSGTHESRTKVWPQLGDTYSK